MTRHNETQACAKWRKHNSLQKPKQKQNSLCCEVGDANSKLSTGQATKKCVTGSTWGAVVTK